MGQDKERQRLLMRLTNRFKKHKTKIENALTDEERNKHLWKLHLSYYDFAAEYFQDKDAEWLRYLYRKCDMFAWVIDTLKDNGFKPHFPE